MPFLAQKVVTEDQNDKKNKIDHPFMILNNRVKAIEKQMVKTMEEIKWHEYKRDSYKEYSLDGLCYLENMIVQQNVYLNV